MNQNVIDNETQEKLDAFIKQEEGDSNDYKGLLAKLITLVAVGMSLFHLYAAYSIVPTQQLRVTHVALVLFLEPLTLRLLCRCNFFSFLSDCFKYFSLLKFLVFILTLTYVRFSRWYSYKFRYIV